MATLELTKRDARWNQRERTLVSGKPGQTNSVFSAALQTLNPDAAAMTMPRTRLVDLEAK
jgi:hypothetical protein